MYETTYCKKNCLGILEYNFFLYLEDRSSDCPHPCVVNGHHFCYPPPCPPPACADPIYAPGQCCALCPDDCPHGTCKINNRTMCYPIPCPHPPCEDPVTTPGDCCPHCPSGMHYASILFFIVYTMYNLIQSCRQLRIHFTLDYDVTKMLS